MTWFERLTGIDERNPEYVQQQLRVENDQLCCLESGKHFQCGKFFTPSLAELRQLQFVSETGPLQVQEQVADVTKLHADPANAGACFQVASQFNLLEMACPRVTPEAGVGIYENDHTQGPACAVACGAGTIYRNYFVPVQGQTGQSARKQVNCLQELGDALDVRIRMQNGYALADADTLFRISEKLKHCSSEDRNILKGHLRIGLQTDTEVTLPGCGHRVHQVYGSALPLGYSDEPKELWEPFARLVLEASYEACVLAALQQQCNRLYLTLLGGGVFGNDPSWITDAILQALLLHRHRRLDVRIVSYGSSKPAVTALVERFKREVF